MTPLDQAHERMTQDPENQALRLRFYQRLVECELFMLLEAEPADDRISPATFALDESNFVLVFDSEERLASFTGQPSPFAAMPGRRVVEMLRGHRTGLAVNPDVAPSSILLPPDVINWINEVLEAARIEETAQRPTVLLPPLDPGVEFLQALDARLAGAAGLAEWAALAQIQDDGGTRTPVLAFVGASTGARETLQQIARDIVAFSANEIQLNLLFLEPDDPLCGPLRKTALVFELPQPAMPGDSLPKEGPGMNPDLPPRLK